MFSDLSIIHTLEQLTDYDEQSFDPVEVGIEIEEFRNLYSAEGLD